MMFSSEVSHDSFFLPYILVEGILLYIFTLEALVGVNAFYIVSLLSSYITFSLFSQNHGMFKGRSLRRHYFKHDV